MAIFVPIRIVIGRVASTVVVAVISLYHHRRISMPLIMGLYAMVIVPVDNGTAMPMSLVAIVMWPDRNAAGSHLHLGSRNRGRNRLQNCESNGCQIAIFCFHRLFSYLKRRANACTAGVNRKVTDR